MGALPDAVVWVAVVWAGLSLFGIGFVAFLYLLGRHVRRLEVPVLTEPEPVEEVDSVPGEPYLVWLERRYTWNDSTPD